jgi:hypothetical protein
MRCPMKTPITLSLITFISLTISLPALCSEKNKFATTMSIHAQDMVSRHTYDYMSPKHIKTGLLLSLLPSQLSLAVLQKQRSNMVTFLRKNEAEALEDVRQYWNYDQETWSNIMKNTEEDIAFNLNILKDSHNYNALHDPNFPSEWIIAINNECKRHKFNINNLDLITTKDDSKMLASADIAYESNGFADTKIITSRSITLNVANEFIQNQSTTDLYNRQLQHTATHEMTHHTQGHAPRTTNILWDKCLKPAFWQTTNFRAWLWGVDDLIEKANIETTQRKQLKEEFDCSPTGKKHTAAKEKTADTLVACSDQQAAKNAYYYTRINGYIDNNNDMKTIHANWQLTQAIEKRRDLYQAFRKKGQDFQIALRKYMPF